jgi:hypothetical protein
MAGESFAVVPERDPWWADPTPWEARPRTRLRVAFDSELGSRDRECCAFYSGVTLNRVRQLARGIGKALVFAGAEADGVVCVVQPGGALEYFGRPRGRVIERAYGRIRSISAVRFDCIPGCFSDAYLEYASNHRIRCRAAIRH